MVEPQQPAIGVTLLKDEENHAFYRINCDCMSEDHSHTLFVNKDAEDDGTVFIELYTKVSVQYTKWQFWKFLWKLFTKGYYELDTDLLLSKQAAVNYANIILTQVKEMEK